MRCSQAANHLFWWQRCRFEVAKSTGEELWGFCAMVGRHLHTCADTTSLLGSVRHTVRAGHAGQQAGHAMHQTHCKPMSCMAGSLGTSRQACS